MTDRQPTDYYPPCKPFSEYTEQEREDYKKSQYGPGASWRERLRGLARKMRVTVLRVRW